MQLSNHLSLAELTRSESAKRKGIDNTPTLEHLKKLKLLAINLFEPIREHFGVPIHISSGYRSKALNDAVGGSDNSQHSRAEAIDIDMDNSSNFVTNAMVFYYILDHVDFDQLIWEFGDEDHPSWVHVSRKMYGPQRKSVLVSYKVGDDTEYKPYNQE